MPNKKESINYLPNLSLFFKVLGFPKPTSFMTKEFLGPCCPDKNTLRDIQNGSRKTYTSTINRIEKCMNRFFINEGEEPIQINVDKDRELGIEQQEWKTYLFFLHRADWKHDFPKTFSLMHRYLLADINELGKTNIHSHKPLHELSIFLIIFAAYEHDYHKLLNIKEPNSIIIDILPKQDGEKILWPMKLLFDSWRQSYSFTNKSVCDLKKEYIFKTNSEENIQYYAIRTISDWIAGATPPNFTQRMSNKTVSWIEEICGSKRLAKREWLRFVMACKLQNLLINKSDALPYISKMYERLFEECRTIS